ncbi:hypothetical protein CKM354_000904100 [Cercospora kikuchii]|uniref:HRQ family protein 2 n=1 Tax=Cercospora kikuchii TaxID=84275 RepID=A0A9P3CNA5_9PEZI|nr:uncharacterized protein CKM354_000904100 [Cercospora kikuchii]GIZ45893.1 hypothetical protein CKM354_000904100 [Cercospora kikuchii]
MTPIFILCLLFVSGLTYLIFRHARKSTLAAKTTTSSSRHNHNHNGRRTVSDIDIKDPYLDIQPLPPTFDWKTTPPIRNSPLKPKYHLTMALENITLSDIIAMDNTYVERMQIRRRVMDEQGEAAMMCNPVCNEAVGELYEWIFGALLPRRFEGMFEIVDGNGNGKERERHGFLRNLVSDEYIPLHEQDPLQALQTLGAHVDTDFLLLLPSRSSTTSSTQHKVEVEAAQEQQQPIYHLQAFICCFPSGFSLQKDKIGRTLAEIHAPVPGYKAKLEKSMDRFFAKLPIGKAVKRSNWAITTDEVLFKEGGNHLYDDDHEQETGGEKLDMTKEVPSSISQQKENVVIENCRLRSERQTLFRLPRTGAIVFSFKTYQYRLEDVKREGYGEELAMAIEGLEKGSVPEMAFYKRQVVWGDKVREFLRS